MGLQNNLFGTNMICRILLSYYSFLPEKGFFFRLVFSNVTTHLSCVHLSQVLSEDKREVLK